MFGDFFNSLFIGAVTQAHSAVVFTAPFAAFVATCAFIFWTGTDEKERPKRAALWGGLAAMFGILTFPAYFGLPALVRYMWPATNWKGFPTWHLYAHVGGIVLGCFVFFAFARFVSPKSNALLRRLTRRNEAERNQRTDVRTIEQHLPKAKGDFDPMAHIPDDPVKRGVFIGLDEKGSPVFIPYPLYKTSHVQVIGTTGAGKGIASTVLLAQSLRAKEATFVIDPKNDEWAPHVLRQEAQRAGVPFYLIDLNKDVPQLNFLDGMTERQLEELFNAGFSLGEKGEAADFYRIGDRKAARIVAGQVGKVRTFLELFRSDECKEAAKYAEGFHAKFDELNRVIALQATTGLDLNSVVQGGGCVYVIGSMRNPRIIAAQRMLLVRLIQLAEQRDRTQAVRQICVFLDEIQYHISRPALEGLGAARDKGVHLILAHQSISDLKNCPADLNPDVVVGAVTENCSLRIAYQIKSADTAEWIARMSGEIQVDDEVRTVERNAALAEKFNPERTVRQAARYLIDVNMLLNLPPRVGVLFGMQRPNFVHICPIRAKKAPLPVFEALPSLADADQAEPLQQINEPPLQLEDLDLNQPPMEWDEPPAAEPPPEPRQSAPAPLELAPFELEPFDLSPQPQGSTNDRNDRATA